MTPKMMPNVHLGVSVENQRMADERIPVLLDTLAAARFLSCEPLLGPLDLRRALPGWFCACGWNGQPDAMVSNPGGSASSRCCPKCGASGGLVMNHRTSIDWVIVGGESGPGSAERKLVERCDCWTGLMPGTRQVKPYPDSPPGHTVTARCSDCGQTGWRPKPQALEWVRSLRDQAVAAGVPFFFKQSGGPRPASGGRLLDGREWSETP